MNKYTPTLVVLDDYEGVMLNAPAMERLKTMAHVKILDHPIAEQDDSILARADVILALRERTVLDRSFFNKCPKLKLILQTGGHAYHLDAQEASKRGILVALGRGATPSTASVPELVFGFMLGLVRQVYTLHNQMKEGSWPTVIGASIYGKTIGILGYGRHGKSVARLAEAFGMNVVVWDRIGTKTGMDTQHVYRLPLADLMKQSDVVSIHLKLSDESKGLITKDMLDLMKPDAILINTSRGAIIREDDLIDVLRKKTIAGAGLDVFEQEPLSASSLLRSLPNVLLTPHIGWKVEAVLHQFVEIASGQLERYLNNTLDIKELLNPEAVK